MSPSPSNLGQAVVLGRLSLSLCLLVLSPRPQSKSENRNGKCRRWKKKILCGFLQGNKLEVQAFFAVVIFGSRIWLQPRPLYVRSLGPAIHTDAVEEWRRERKMMITKRVEGRGDWRQIRRQQTGVDLFQYISSRGSLWKPVDLRVLFTNFFTILLTNSSFWQKHPFLFNLDIDVWNKFITLCAEHFYVSMQEQLAM